MNISYQNGVMQVGGVCFDPELTLMDSAQVFHWKKEGDGFSGVSAGRKAHLVPVDDGFELHSVSEGDLSFWRSYFDLDRDYGSIIHSCSAYPIAERAMRLLPGMRVLNQPVWETLISFILSANNNVSRIRTLVEKLIMLCGENGGFPSPEQLSGVGEESLRAIGCGYRAPYLVKTAQMILDGFPLEGLRQLSYGEAHRQLILLPGVGDKVADCVQLFGMGQSEAFPVDVWIERLMISWFLHTPHSKKEIRRKAHDMFGLHAGIIQQSLFHCARMGLIELDVSNVRSTEER